MARLLRNTSILKSYLHTPQASRNIFLGASSQLNGYATKAKKRTKLGGSDKSAGSDSGDDMAAKRDIALQQAIDQIESSFGKGSIMWLGRDAGHKEVPVISTGSITLDTALGVGGLPKGRVVEIYGPEASGKTTLALHVIAEAQKLGGYCVFIDAEHALDPSLAEAIGVDTHNLLLSQPDCGEQALSLVDTVIRSGAVDVVVVDSVAALVPKGELDGEMGDAHMAMQARLMSQALRKLCHALSTSQTVLIFINQVRAKLNTFGFGAMNEVTCGGNALKFYASMRLNIKRIGSVKQGEEVTGSVVQVKIVKNKHAPPFRAATFELEFGKGISQVAEILELGAKYKLLKKAGGGYFTIGGQPVRGKDGAQKFLIDNPEIRDDILAKLREKLMLPNGNKDSETDSETVDDAITTDEDVAVAVVVEA